MLEAITAAIAVLDAATAFIAVLDAVTAAIAVEDAAINLACPDRSSKSANAVLREGAVRSASKSAGVIRLRMIAFDRRLACIVMSGIYTLPLITVMGHAV